MVLTQSCLSAIARIGFGGIFFASFILDIKARGEIFELMKKKNVIFPTVCFYGALTWKLMTSLELIANFYTYWAALSLSLYIFLANLVFNNFWSAPLKQRNFSMAMFITHLATCIGLLAVAANTMSG
jgi:uncharacterized membrane protein YphA (DoxX/SURF4 family)